MTGLERSAPYRQTKARLSLPVSSVQLSSWASAVISDPEGSPEWLAGINHGETFDIVGERHRIRTPRNDFGARTIRSDVIEKDNRPNDVLDDVAANIAFSPSGGLVR